MAELPGQKFFLMRDNHEAVENPEAHGKNQNRQFPGNDAPAQADNEIPEVQRVAHESIRPGYCQLEGLDVLAPVEPD